MLKRTVLFTLTLVTLGARTRAASAVTCTSTNTISATATPNKIGRKTVFDVGGSNFGASLVVRGGLTNAADAKAEAALVATINKAMGLEIPIPSIPADLVHVVADAEAHLDFFGKGITLLALGAKASRSSGAFSKRFTIEVAGIDLYSGSNTLPDTTKPIGPYTMPFYTIGTKYGVAYAEGTIVGEIGMTARAHAASDGLMIDGRFWTSLGLEGSAGVSVGVAGAGLFANVDLVEVGQNFKNSIGLTAGSPYDFFNTYDASSLDGAVALKASALGGTTTLWHDSWNGVTYATRALYDVDGCVQ